MRKIYTLLFLVILFASCNSTKELKTFSGNQLIFGSGGGVTGQTIEYVLSYNGEINKEDSLTNETTSLPSISSKEAKGFYKQFLNHGFDTLEFSSPGNITYFIGYKSQDGEKKISWGGAEQPPAEVKEFYESITQTVKK